MATIKSFTDLEQSRKLAEILPLESADMCWILVNYGDEAGSRHEPSLATYKTGSHFRDRIFPKDYTIPCWSLAALLGVLPMIGKGEDTANPFIAKAPNGGYYVVYAILTEEIDSYGTIYDNPVDACFEMILKLNELNLL